MKYLSINIFFLPLLWFNELMEVCPFQGRKKGVPGLSCRSVTGYKKSVWTNERGSVLIPVIIFTSAAILVVAVAISMIPTYQKEALFLQQKLSRDVLEYGITQIVGNEAGCACLFDGKTINTVTLSPIELTDIKKGGCGSEALISKDSSMGYGVEVKSIKLNNLEERMADIYKGDLTVSYNKVGLFRSIEPLKIPLQINTDVTVVGTLKPVFKCLLSLNVVSDSKGNCGFGGSQKGNPHNNGGGFVADTATVDATAYVGPDAKVCGEAQVLGNARVEDYAVVMDNSKVYGSAKVYDSAKILGGSEVYNEAKVYDNAVISYQSKVYDKAEVSGITEVEYSEVYGEARVSDHAKVLGSKVLSKSTVTGYAVVESGSMIGATIGPTNIILVSDMSNSPVVTGYSRVARGGVVTGTSKISDNANVERGTKVSGAVQVTGDTRVDSGEYLQ